jgi:hypothetical protein
MKCHAAQTWGVYYYVLYVYPPFYGELLRKSAHLTNSASGTSAARSIFSDQRREEPIIINAGH